jgi:Mg-chelatase subunit ChlD
VPYDTNDFIARCDNPVETPAQRAERLLAMSEASSAGPSFDVSESAAAAQAPASKASGMLLSEEVMRRQEPNKVVRSRFNEKARVAKMLVPVSPEQVAAHNKLLKAERKITQHVVLVLDASKSMAKRDAFNDDASSELFNSMEKMSRIENVRLSVSQ